MRTQTRKRVVLTLISMFLLKVATSQEVKLFKDINKTTRPLEILDLKTIQDSLIFCSVKSENHDSTSFYILDKSKEVLKEKTLNSDTKVYPGKNVVFLLEKEKNSFHYSLYSIKPSEVTKLYTQEMGSINTSNILVMGDKLYLFFHQNSSNITTLFRTNDKSTDFDSLMEFTVNSNPFIRKIGPNKIALTLSERNSNNNLIINKLLTITDEKISSLKLLDDFNMDEVSSSLVQHMTNIEENHSGEFWITFHPSDNKYFIDRNSEPHFYDNKFSAGNLIMKNDSTSLFLLSDPTYSSSNHYQKWLEFNYNESRFDTISIELSTEIAVYNPEINKYIILNYNGSVTFLDSSFHTTHTVTFPNIGPVENSYQSSNKYFTSKNAIYYIKTIKSYTYPLTIIHKYDLESKLISEVFNSRIRNFGEPKESTFLVSGIIETDGSLYFSVEINRSSRGVTFENEFGKHHIWELNSGLSGLSSFKTFTEKTYSSNPIGLNHSGNSIYFFSEQIDGHRLYQSELNPSKLTTFVDTIFYNGNTPSHNQGLIHKAGNKLFFELNNSSTKSTISRHLAFSDGTKEGTQFVKDQNGNTFFNPTEIKVYKDKVLFISRNKLWITDGSVENTHEISIDLNHTHGFPAYAFFNNSLYYLELTAQEVGLWKYDFAENTSSILITKNYSYYDPLFLDTYPEDILRLAISTSLGEYELFSIDKQDVIGNPITLKTSSLKELKLVRIQEYYYFINRYIKNFRPTENYGLWRTDGTASGTVLIDPNFNGTEIHANKNKLFSIVLKRYNEESTYRSRPYFFDHNLGTHQILFDSLLTPRNEVNYRYSEKTDSLFFFKRGEQQYVSDGTSEGTGKFNYNLENTLNVNNTIFFTADSEKYGNELFWITACPERLFLHNNIYGNSIFQSSEEIIANGTLDVNSNIIFRAGGSITLGAGFFTEKAATFKAEIENCLNY